MEKYKPTKVVILRGPTAVGKSTIADEVILQLKREEIYCALITEDHFRKKIQRKYKAADPIVHHNSVDLITTIIPKLLDIDEYSVIFIEGLLRYEEMLTKYQEFCRKNKYDLTLFQCEAPFEVRKERNQLSKTRDHTVKIQDKQIDRNPEEFQLPGSITLNTNRPLTEIVKEVIGEIL